MVNQGRTRWASGWALLALLLWGGGPAEAQILAGAWVAESDQRIDAVRKTDLRVIVLGADGRPAAGAKVHVDQTRSDFHVGVVLPESGWPEALGTDAELWRCVNAVSLRRFTAWPRLQPAVGFSLNYDAAERIDALLKRAETRGLYVRWGPLVSADVGRVPPWVAELSGAALAEAVTGYGEQVWARFAGRVDQYDMYTETLDHQLVETRAGLAAVRRLYEGAGAADAGTLAVAHFTDALSFERVQHMQRQLTAMREAFIPVDVVALDQRFSGRLDRRQMERMLRRLDPIDHPVVISGLSVGADSELNAAVNMETVLRTLMERPYIRGIWFTDLSPDTALDRSGALLDERGAPTPAGRAVDGLFHGLWRTDVETTADELGNVRLRAFPGAYRVRATLADGTVIQTRFRLQKRPEARVVLLEPLKPVGR